MNESTEHRERLQPAPAALLWDVDGTLTDSTELIADALEYVYEQFYNRTLPYEERRALIGTPLKKQIRVFGEPETFGTDEQTVLNAFIAYYEAHHEREEMRDEVIAALRKGKRQGVPTGLVTSKNRAELANTLPRLGVVDCIDLAITADDVVRPKPDPEGLRTALRMLNLSDTDAKNVVYIGDTVYDMRAAHPAGVRSIAVTWGAASRVLLEAEKPSFLCHTYADLSHLLFGTDSI